MVNKGLGDGRQIVMCDGCGTPYAAVVERDVVSLVGRGRDDCPNCEGSEFSQIRL